MIVYVETNFTLELALLQEQSDSCEEILRLCDGGRIRLVLPTYCVVEPFDTLVRRHRARRRLYDELRQELTQLSRTSAIRGRVHDLTVAASLLIDSVNDEQKRFRDVRSRLLSAAELIPLTCEILEAAAGFESSHRLERQDAVVYASVLQHLSDHPPSDCCFLNKNTKDFNDPDIVDALAKHKCKLLTGFDNGYRYICSCLP